MAQTLDVTLSLRDDFSKGLAAQEQNVKRFASGIGLAIGAAGAAIGVGIGKSISVAADFNQSLSNIAAVGGPQAAAAMDDIRAKALQVGKDTAFSSVQAAGAMEELVKAGVPVQAALDGVLDATVALAAAGEIALPQAAEIASAAMNQFQLSAQDMPRVADIMAGAANASAIDVGDFGESIKALGPAASTAGVSIDDAGTAIALMGNYGIKGSMAGNTLKRALISLAAPTAEASAVMQKYGINAFDAAGKLKPMPAVAQELQDALGGLTNQQQVDALNTLFGTFGMAGGAVMMKEGAEGFREMAGEMAKVTAADVAREKLNNLNGAVTIMQGSLETLGVMFGSAFQPVLMSMVQGFTAVINAAMPMAEAFGVWLPPAVDSARLAFQSALGWVQENWPIFAVVIGMAATTVITTLGSMAIQGAISLAQFTAALLLTGPVAVAKFLWMAASSAFSFGVMVAKAIWAAPMIAAQLITVVIPALIQMAAQFLLAKAQAVLSFVGMLAQAVLSAGGIAVAFLTQTVPAMAAAGLSFLATLAQSAIAFPGMLIGAVTSAAGIAVSFLTTVIPAAVAVGIGFLSMLATSLIAFAGMVAGAVMTGIGIMIAFWPITLAALAVIAIAILVWRNWDAILGFIVKTTAVAGQWIAKLLSGAMTFAAKIVGTAVNWIGERFSGLRTAAVGLIGKMSSGVRKGIAGMAKWVTDIIAKMVNWVGEKLSAMISGILSMISKIPGAASLGGFVSGGIESVKGMFATIKGISFDAGSDSGEAMIDGWNHGARDAARSGGADSFLAPEFMGDLGGDLDFGGDFGGIGGGGGAGGAAAKDPLGMWSGTDNKGAWTIDPGTGKKIYEAGSVGALAQQNAASDKAAKDAAKQAKKRPKSKLGKAVAGAMKGDESLNLAEAFTSAIAEAADLMGEITDAVLPSREQWMPKLDLITQFFIDVGQVFSRVAADARNKSDKITGQGAITKNDIENLMVFAEPWMQAMDALDKTISTMGSLSDLKVPPLTILDDVEAFMIRAADAGKALLARVETATAQLWIPIGQGFGAWLDALGKAAKTAGELAGLPSLAAMERGLERAQAFMEGVAAKTGRFAMSAQEVLGDELEDALLVSQDIAGTFGKWFDELAKVGKAATSIVEVRLPSGWQERLEGFMTGVAAIGATYVTGLGSALPPEARGPALALSRDVAATFGAWGEALVKIGDAATKIATAKPVTQAHIDSLRELMTNIATIGASFLRGPGYDLTADAKRTAQDLGIVRDVFATLTAGVDTIAKAAGLDLSKAVRATESQLAIARSNAVAAMTTLQSIVYLYITPGGEVPELTKTLWEGAKLFGDTLGAAVTALGKAADLGLDKAVRVTGQQLDIARANAVSAMLALQSIVHLYMRGGEIPELTKALWEGIKLFGDGLGGAVDALGKAADLGLSEASRVTGEQLRIAAGNARAAAAVLEDIVFGYFGPDGAIPALTIELWEGVKLFGETLGSAIEALTKAGGLGLANATRVTTRQLTTAAANARAAMAVVEDLAFDYFGPDGALPKLTVDLWEGVKLFGDALGSAVGALGDAATLGAELAAGSRVTAGGLELAQFNARAAMTAVQDLAADYAHLEASARTVLFDSIKDFADVAGKAVGLLADAADLSGRLAKARPVSAASVQIVKDTIISSVRVVADAVSAVGPDALALAHEASLKVGPIAQAIGNVLDAFDMEKIMKNPLIVSKLGSNWMTGVRQRRASAMAEQIRAGLVLTFSTIVSAASAIPDMSGEAATKVAALVSAYDPLLDMLTKLSELSIDLGKVETLARVPAILAGGMVGIGGAGGPGTGGRGEGGGALTGPVTVTGPTTIHGDLNVALSVEGRVLAHVQRSGSWRLARGRTAGAAGTV